LPPVQPAALHWPSRNFQKIYCRVHVSRHDQVKLGLAAALKTVPDITVEVEPRVPLSDLIPGINNPQRRNENRLTGSAASGMTSADFDIHHHLPLR